MAASKVLLTRKRGVSENGRLLRDAGFPCGDGVVPMFNTMQRPIMRGKSGFLKGRIYTAWKLRKTPRSTHSRELAS